MPQAGDAALLGRWVDDFASDEPLRRRALLLELEPDLTPAQVKQRLIETADPPASTAPGRRDGYGIVNPLRALAGVPLPHETGEAPVEQFPAEPLPDPVQRDMGPVYAGIGIGAAALFLVGMGLGLSFTVPAARRRAGRRPGAATASTTPSPMPPPS